MPEKDANLDAHPRMGVQWPVWVLAVLLALAGLGCGNEGDSSSSEAMGDHAATAEDHAPGVEDSEAAVGSSAEAPVAELMPEDSAQVAAAGIPGFESGLAAQEGEPDAAAAVVGDETAGERVGGEEDGETREVVLVDGQWPIQVVSAGMDLSKFEIDNLRRIGDDPEIALRGYREAAPNDLQLEDGASSAEDLSRRILEAIWAEEMRALLDLSIDFREFSEILWPEFPQSRPITGIQAEDSWAFLFRSISSGIDRMFQEYGGQALEFRGLTFSKGLTRYPNFDLIQGVEIHAYSKAREQEVVVEHVHTFVEKDGVWKIYILKD